MAISQVLFCVICQRPVENDSLGHVDEGGNPVHERCYVERITKTKPTSSFKLESKFDCFA